MAHMRLGFVVLFNVYPFPLMLNDVPPVEHIIRAPKKLLKITGQSFPQS